MHQRYGTHTFAPTSTAVLKDLKTYYLDYPDQGDEFAGFVWWKGHKDQNAAHAAKYEENLVRLIKSLRKDFDALGAKFVLATAATPAPKGSERRSRRPN
jgi:hypothetical protein